MSDTDLINGEVSGSDLNLSIDKPIAPQRMTTEDALKILQKKETETNIRAANNWDEVIDHTIEALSNAPSIEDMVKRQRLGKEGKLREVSPLLGDLVVENIDLLPDTFDLIEEEFSPGFKEKYWHHEVEGHLKLAQEKGLKAYMVFSFGLDNKTPVGDGDSVRYDRGLIAPFVLVEFPNETPQVERLQTSKELLMVVGENDLSTGDREALKNIDIALSTLNTARQD